MDNSTSAGSKKASTKKESAPVNQKTKNGQIWQFVTELRDFKPRMWRRFQISSTAKLQDFCFAVLQMFHCMGSHLHQLVVGAYGSETYYVSYEDEDFPDPRNILMTSHKVCDVFKNEKDKASLEYDFGDGWDFKITLEKTDADSRLDDDTFAKALTGKGFGIIEDCGGVWGLAELYEALKGGELPENFDSAEDMNDWLENVLPCDVESLQNGGFDYFDIDYINEQIEDAELLRTQYMPD